MITSEIENLTTLLNGVDNIFSASPRMYGTPAAAAWSIDIKDNRFGLVLFEISGCCIYVRDKDFGTNQDLFPRYKELAKKYETLLKKYYNRMAPAFITVNDIELPVSKLKLTGFKPYNAFPELVGLSEAADILGIDRKTAAVYRKRGKLPEPDCVLKAGPIWEKETIVQFKKASE